MKTIAKQQGITLLGLVCVLGLIAFFVMIALKLVPIYIEYFNVVTSLESLKNEPELINKSPAEVLQLLNRRLDINDVDHVDHKNLRIKRYPGRTEVGVVYEIREPLMGNIDIVTKFDKSVQLEAR